MLRRDNSRKRPGFQWPAAAISARPGGRQ